MSDKKESFKTDIGNVEIDLRKQSITVDGKPLSEVTTNNSYMELLLRDTAIDRKIMESMRNNCTNVKTWLPGCGNRQVREIFRKFTEDMVTCIEAMIKQKNLQMITMIRMEKEWKKIPTAEILPSMSGVQPVPPATPAPEAPKSPEQASAT